MDASWGGLGAVLPSGFVFQDPWGPPKPRVAEHVGTHAEACPLDSVGFFFEIIIHTMSVFKIKVVRKD